jgi:hypothetical protein
MPAGPPPTTQQVVSKPSCAMSQSPPVFNSLNIIDLFDAEAQN